MRRTSLGMHRYASPTIGVTQHQGFEQGLNYFYIFFAIGKQGIARSAAAREEQKHVTVFATIRIPQPAEVDGFDSLALST